MSGTITDSAPFIGSAIARGLAFLGGVQLPDGELPTMRWLREDSQHAFVETTVFGTALIVGVIADVRGTDVIVTKAARFIEAEMLRFGVWKYSRVMGGGFAPDLDDTAMATHALQCARRPAPANRHVFLANRRRDGLFYTWISPRPRWLLDPRMWPIAAARWRHPFVHYRTFNAIAAEDDVDAVVNANVLFHLGRMPETEPVIAFLLRVLRGQAEEVSDKWYDNRFLVWYFLSRALRRAGEESGRLLVERVRSTIPRTPLEHALAACVLLDWGEPADAHLSELLATQLDSGAWPLAVIYKGGDDRWGSESLTTSFCLHALSRVTC